MLEVIVHHPSELVGADTGFSQEFAHCHDRREFNWFWSSSSHVCFTSQFFGFFFILFELFVKVFFDFKLVKSVF